MRVRPGLLCVLCGLSALACTSAPTPTRVVDPIETLALDEWRRTEIAGLTLYTNAPDGEAQTVLRRMEQYVAFLGDFLGGFRLDGAVTEARPTNVFLFAEEAQMRLFTPGSEEEKSRVAGFVIDSFPRTSLASSVRASSPALSVFRHELVHVVLANEPERHPPRWVHEGLAVYFSTVTLRSDVLTLGKSSQRGVMVGRAYREALPLARIFSWDGTEAIDIMRFYADAWAFVHYGLQSAALDGPNRVVEFRDFVDRVGRGDHWEPALKAAFGASLTDIEQEFRQHRRRLLDSDLTTVMHFKVPIPTEVGAFEAVPQREIAARLGEFASQVENGNPDVRRRLYDFLLETDPDDSAAITGRMRVAVLDRDLELAARLWGRVPAGSRQSIDALLARAELDTALWLSVPAQTRKPGSFADARDAWGRVLVVEPDHVAALLALGELYIEATEQDPRTGIDALRRATALDPQLRSIRLDLARLLIRAGELDAARRELEPLASEAGSTTTTMEARRLLRQTR